MAVIQPTQAPASIQLAVTPGALFLLALLTWFSGGDPLLLCGILLSVALHELGHIVMALHYGVQVSAIGCNAMGAFIRRSPSEHDSAIAICGPIVNLCLATLFAGVPLLGVFNICLFLATAMPVKGTDGYRFLFPMKASRLD